jgi:hypothetical protein
VTQFLYDAEGTQIELPATLLDSYGDLWDAVSIAWPAEKVPQTQIARGFLLSRRRGKFGHKNEISTIVRTDSTMLVDLSEIEALTEHLPTAQLGRSLTRYYAARFSSGPAKEIVKNHIAENRGHMAEIRQLHARGLKGPSS